ncbi:hypothetical protein [Paenibacillus macerans]
MWQLLLERLPSIRVIVCAALSTAIPLVVYLINQKLHRYGDPPWKKEKP